MERRWRLAAASGIVLAVVAFAVEGPGLAGHTLDHVVADLTVELWPHVLLAGLVLIAYGGVREVLSRRAADDGSTRRG